MLRKYLFLQNKQDKNTDLAKCERQAFYISGKEKDAVNVERQVNDYKRAEYMEDKIGQILGIGYGNAKQLKGTLSVCITLDFLWNYQIR